LSNRKPEFRRQDSGALGARISDGGETRQALTS
jgi:hypothetical protein